MRLKAHPDDDTRSSREAGCFPYGYPGVVCYIEVGKSGGLRQIHGREAIRGAIQRAKSGTSRIYATWPGQHRTDLFFIDDLASLEAATTLQPRVARPTRRAGVVTPCSTPSPS